MIPQPTIAPRIAEEPVRLRLHAPIRSTSASDDSDAGTGPNIFGYLKYRWVTVLFLGGLLAAALGYLAWSLVPSKYTTTAMIRVSADQPTLYSSENPIGRNDFTTYLKTQGDMLRSQFVLAAALREPGIADTSLLREQVDPIQFLTEEILVETKEGSEIIKLSLRGDDPRAIAAIVNSIQSAYFREVVEDELKRKKARLVLLEDTIQSMQKEVAQKYLNLQKAEAPQKPANQVTQIVGAQLAVGQVVRLKEILVTVEGDLKSWTAKRDGIQNRINNLASELPPVQTLMESIDADPKIQALSKQHEQYQSRLDYYIDKLGADVNHPAVVDLTQKMGEVKEHREQMRKARFAELEKGLTQQALKKLHVEMDEAANALNRLANRKEQTQKLIDEYQAAVVNPAGPEERPVDFMRVDIREREAIIKGMLDKANLLRLEVSAPPRVRPFQSAAVPMKREMKKQFMATGLAVLFGFALVGFFVVAYESRVKRALSLADVQKATLGPIVGVVPGATNPGDKGPAPEAVAEALDKTRSLLQQQFDRPGSKLILIGSATRDEGKSALACKLAESFSRTGSRTLLVDFDLRSPTLHWHLQAANDAGFCEALSGVAELPAVIQELPNGLHLLPAGKWSDGVRVHLLTERLRPLFARLREHYDCIIVNSHPLLAVAETSVAARFADGVLLAVEKHESRLPLVARAQDKLAALAPDSFGIVFLGASEDECLN